MKRTSFLACLFVLILAPVPGLAQIQESGYVATPSPSTSILGQTQVAMTNATCNVVTPGSNCTVSGLSTSYLAAYVQDYYLTGSLSSPQILVIPLQAGGYHCIGNSTGQTITAGGITGSTVSVLTGQTQCIISHDGVGYVISSPSSGSTISIQTAGTPNTSQAVLNHTASSTNTTGIALTPTNPSGGIEKYEATGTVNATSGGTGIDSHSSTGVAQVNAGTWSVSTGLADGTTATTQTVGDNTTKIATDAFVLANSSLPASPSGSIQYNNSGVFGGSANATLDGSGNATEASATLSNLTASSLVGSDGSKKLVTIAALPNGTTATTQATGDATTKVATDAFVNASIASAAISVQTNATPNASQTTLNFQTSTVNATGLTLTPTNASGGNEKTEVTGTVNVASGGTGDTTLTSGSALIGAGTSAVTFKALAGAGAALTTGPASSASGDAVVFAGTAGQVADAGFAPSPATSGIPNCPLQNSQNICLSQASYYASGSAGAATITVSSGGTTGTLGGNTCTGAEFDSTSAGFQYGHQGIYIAGAGAAGGRFVGTVTSCVGGTIVWTPATSTSVTNAVVLHDEGAAFQSAVNAIASTGGNIWLPILSISGNTPATYNINGPLQDTGGANAIVKLPTRDIATLPTVNIHIQSYNLPSENGIGPAILQSTLSTAGGAIFGGYDAASGVYPPFTAVSLEVDNVTVYMPTDTSAWAFNAGHLLYAQFEHDLIRTQNPGTHAGTDGGGIWYPQILNQYRNKLDDVTIAGFYNGAIITEHTDIGSVYPQGSTNALVFDSGTNTGKPAGYLGDSIHIDYVWFGSNTNDIVGSSTAAHPATINIANADSETNSGFNVLDTQNNLHGTVNFFIPDTPGQCSPTVSGATNLNITAQYCQGGVTLTTPAAGGYGASVNFVRTGTTRTLNASISNPSSGALSADTGTPGNGLATWNVGPTTINGAATISTSAATALSETTTATTGFPVVNNGLCPNLGTGSGYECAFSVGLGTGGTQGAWFGWHPTGASAGYTVMGVLGNPNNMSLYPSGGVIIASSPTDPGAFALRATGGLQNTPVGSSTASTGVFTTGQFNTSLKLLSGGTAMTANQGTGTSLQHSTGSTTTNNCTKFDSTGNTVDAGAACGTGNALTANPLSQFASTTSAQLAGVLSDETGTGVAVFSASPALTGTPTAPTAAGGTNTTQVATTAFVQSAVTSPIHIDSWSISPVLFAVNTVLGAIYYERLGGTYTAMTARLSGAISCAVAPSVSIADLGTSPNTAFGSIAGTVDSLSTGTSDGGFSKTGSVTLTPGNYYGIYFGGGTCVTAPQIDITMTVN